VIIDTIVAPERPAPRAVIGWATDSDSDDFFGGLRDR
jgi:hypothetical protein